MVPFPILEKTPGLTNKESQAFSEIARELNDRLKSGKTVLEDDFGDERSDPIGNVGAPEPAPPVVRAEARCRAARNRKRMADPRHASIGILIYRLNELIYANRAFLEWTGYGSLQALQAAGGLDSLFIEPSKEPNSNGKNGKALATPRRAASSCPCKAGCCPTTTTATTRLS